MGRENVKAVDKTSLTLIVPDGSNLDKLIGGLAGALNRHADAIAKPGDSLARALREQTNTELISAINNLKEIVMGLKEDLDALNGRFDRMESAVDAAAADITALKDELKEANERANIDLVPLIARAEGIESRLLGAAGPNAGSDPEPTPEPTPEEPPV